MTEASSPADLMEKSFTAVANKDLFGMGTLRTEDVVEDFVVLGPVRGKQAVLAFFAELFAALPDMQFTTERIMGVDANTAVGQWTIKGTFAGGTFQGIEPTGRVVEISGIDVMEFEDGLLRHNTIYYDGLAFARQIGMLPAEGSRSDRAMLKTFNTATKTKARVRRSS